MRQQLQGELRRLQAIGRSLLLNWEMAVSGRWWAESSWAGILQAMPPWIVAQLESWKRIIEALDSTLSCKRYSGESEALWQKQRKERDTST